MAHTNKQYWICATDNTAYSKLVTFFVLCMSLLTIKRKIQNTATFILLEIQHLSIQLMFLSALVPCWCWGLTLCCKLSTARLASSTALYFRTASVYVLRKVPFICSMQTYVHNLSVLFLSVSFKKWLHGEMNADLVAKHKSRDPRH